MNGADTAWILTSTALVLFMTLPGLALFYAGLVRAQNTLSVLMNCFAIACVMSIVWLVAGYSVAFGDGGAVWGGLGKVFLTGVGTDSLSGTLPETVFFMFQMTFAIITPALIVGAYVERIHFSFVIVFSALWGLIVYAPVTHWIWGGGFLAGLGGNGVRDFAGGLVVHLTAGATALVLAVMLGVRRGFPGELKPPHSPGLTMMGAAMLWVGWFGFNGGSALAADSNAGMAMTVTHIAAAAGSLAWAGAEWVRFGKPSLVGIVTGMVAGLATITPASGFVGPFGGLVLGVAGGLVCQWFVGLVKQQWKIDDSLDVFAVHGVGGVLGSILVAFFAAPSLGGLGLGDASMFGQLWVQLIGIAAVGAWTVVATYVLAKGLALVLPFRVSGDVETEGLDLALHGERSYEL